MAMVITKLLPICVEFKDSRILKAKSADVHGQDRRKQFTLIYSIFSGPNVVLCFLINRFLLGIRLGTIIYMLILLVDQLIFASGAIIDTFWLIILAESLAIAQPLWLKAKERFIGHGQHLISK
ncbi:lysosomal dipeptide transporter MFSD1 [Drosophila virilis]|uniref:Uncharacterized protein n=1 Tax=Drosophila virilis TaxID=7244 RepID=A0A0Q9WPD6_DROVI|nr:major facilitator superfamily domain-containing protein 1 [Drosophila virilis]KRF83863.1 uncharacterized protein Dvir_GJ12693 [Drosophila virilis]